MALITEKLIVDAIDSSWNMAHECDPKFATDRWDSIKDMLTGMRNLCIYSDSDEAFALCRFLWDIASERHMMAWRIKYS